jgi:3-isopropylmalate/(R)-2-methylmalate dehydratase large subunit
MGMTVAEKILSRHADGALRAGEIALCETDFLMATDTTAPLAIKAFHEMGGRQVTRSERAAFVIDHAAPCPSQKIAQLHSVMRRFAAEQGIVLYDVGEGICHQLVIENGHVRPGDLAVGADSHTCTYGAVGAFATGVGSTELAAAMLTGKVWLKVPETFRITLHDRLPAGVCGKDLILNLIGRLGADGASYKSLEFHGDGLEGMALSDRLTVCNMVVEAGAKCGIVCDPAGGVHPDSDAHVAAEFAIDLAALEPTVAAPHSVDNIRPIGELETVEIQQGFIGSCTNGRIEDLRAAARILAGRKTAPGVRLYIIPASKSIFLQAIREGLVETLTEAGGVFITSGCGPCVGTHNGIPGDGETVISSSNRNFKGRMGNNQASVYLASPATVAASVLHGRITDPRRLG